MTLSRPGVPKTFPPNHPWDRNFFLVMVALAWVGIIKGFGGSIADHIAKKAQPYPLIVHFHAVVFVSWLVLFTVQILLIRYKKLPVHKQLGMAMVWLAGLIAIVGPSTALTVQHHGMNSAGADPAFLCVQFTDILAFTGLVTAAIVLRKAPSAHKRLILLATLYITDAGFARWMADGWIHLVGDGFWGFWIALYFAPNVLILMVGAYDLVTRRRLNPAFIAGLSWVLAVQMTAMLLYRSPSWLAFSKKLIAHWP